MSGLDLTELKRQKQVLQDQKVRAREAAKRLGIAEAQFVALGDTPEVVRLKPDFLPLFHALSQVGEVMALTRNDAIVFEHKGIYTKCVFKNGVLKVEGLGIDLILDINQIVYGFQVNENGRISLQFFDAFGQAVHKVYMTETTNDGLWVSLFARYTKPLSEQNLQLPVVAQPVLPKMSRLLDYQAMEADWQRILTEEQFKQFLKDYKITAPMAYRLLLKDAWRFQPNALMVLLTALSEQQLACKMTVYNGATRQVHLGKINKLLQTVPWFNVLDASFNCHAMISQIDQVWCIEMAMDITLSKRLEFFDAYHQCVLRVEHSEEKLSPTALLQWQTIICQLPKREENLL